MGDGQTDQAAHQMAPPPFAVSCFGPCGSSGAFDRSPSSRLCRKPDCIGDRWPAERHATLVSMVPALPADFDVRVLPRITAAAPLDLFARWADDPSDLPPAGAVGSDGMQACAQFLPYATDFLSEQVGVRCGTPALYRSRRLEAWLGLQRVYVLDMSGYLWSHTLKDPRSWAVVNSAVSMNVRHLAAWTAGNAGWSLAKIVRACNHFRAASDRLQVYALYDRFDRSMADPVVRSALRQWGCEMIAVPSVGKEILPPEEIRNRVRDRAGGLQLEWSNEQYWDVTDGWDAVGMVMYRLLSAQVVRDIQPTHIIAPLGTGNLMLGLLLGVDDNRRCGALSGDPPTLIGAVPKEDNIVDEIARGRRATPRYRRPSPKGKKPLMPKIAGTYTPLLTCVDYALERGLLQYAPISLDEQQSAAVVLARPAHGRRILAEPSSIAAFAALPQVADRYLTASAESRVLVVNTGFGLMSRRELALLSAASSQ